MTMNVYAVLFYLLAGVTVAATALAVTRRNAVHAVIYLILSLVGVALLFYLLGAPTLAALEVIVYAGGIMVLFLFILVIVGALATEDPAGSYWLRWLPAVLLGAGALAASVTLILRPPASAGILPALSSTPAAFGRFVFERYWLAVEAASLLLFLALVGALFLGRGEMGPRREEP